jgi:hypothetical protein
MSQTDQTPLTPNVVQAAQQKPSETPRFFDLSKHRFDDHFASAVQRPGRVWLTCGKFGLAQKHGMISP